jgi:hypothetical protein
MSVQAIFVAFFSLKGDESAFPNGAYPYPLADNAAHSHQLDRLP